MKGIKYHLDVEKDYALVPYVQRQKLQGEFVQAVYKNRLQHDTLPEADKAAKAISQSPIVVKVSLTRVETSIPIVYRNGKESR